jgi:hypothetical protein
MPVSRSGQNARISLRAECPYLIDPLQEWSMFEVCRSVFAIFAPLRDCNGLVPPAISSFGPETDFMWGSQRFCWIPRPVRGI